MKLNIMTYNIASGRYYHNDADFLSNGGSKVVNLTKCGDVIREISPDFCGINEVNFYEEQYVRRMALQSPEDQTNFLAEYTGLSQYYFGKAIHFKNRGDYGDSILSKHAILSAETIPIPDPKIKDETGYYETRGIAKVTLDIAGGITVLQTHLGKTVSESQLGVVELCRVIDEINGPLIVMGDFNIRPDNFLLDRIRARLQEIAPTEPGYHHTFPSWTHDAEIPMPFQKHPYCKIDYIFASRHFKQLDCRVYSVRVSDHMPMLATLEMVE